MQKVNLKKMVIAALFAALSCVATMLIHIPTPGTGGYIHPGDAVVILCGVLLGPVYGGLAAGIGSALADIFFGYFLYAPVTFIIKFGVATVAGLLCAMLLRQGKKPWLAVLMGGIADILLVAGGYLLYESFIYGFAGAVASVPANLVQGSAGLVLAMVFYPLLAAVPDIRQLILQNRKGE